MRRRPIAATAAVLAAVLVMNVAAAAPAVADLAHSKPVSANPVDYTPHVLDGTVWDVALVGTTVVVGGDFSEVSDAAGKTFYDRTNLFAFDLYTGAVTPLKAEFDGPVYALVAGPAGTVYAAGAFRKVNGTAQRGIARLLMATGARDAGFTTTINWGDVRELHTAGGWLYAGGSFTAIGGLNRTALARLNAATGAVDPNFDAKIAAPGLARARVEDFAISPNGSRLVAIGAIQQAGGVKRAQLAMYDLTTPVPTLSAWNTTSYAPPCRAGFDTYMRGIDFAPDSSYFVVVTTGRASDPKKMCDTAARFTTAGVGPQLPVWVNHTGGDSLYTASITGPAVYVGGHQRWQNNPYGHETAGKGAVSRKGIAAIDPVSGLATPWDPTRDRGVGVRAMLATPAGLLVGSDTEKLGKEYHGRIGMFPVVP